MRNRTPRTKAGKVRRVKSVMKRWKSGSLHSGKGGPRVTSQKQAVAISLRLAGVRKKKR